MPGSVALKPRQNAYGRRYWFNTFESRRLYLFRVSSSGLCASYVACPDANGNLQPYLVFDSSTLIAVSTDGRKWALSQAGPDFVIRTWDLGTVPFLQPNNMLQDKVDDVLNCLFGTMEPVGAWKPFVERERELKRAKPKVKPFEQQQAEPTQKRRQPHKQEQHPYQRNGYGDQRGAWVYDRTWVDYERQQKAKQAQPPPASAAPAKKSWYEVLEVQASASVDEIKAAFRRLTKTRHPDRGGTDAQFRELYEAYDLGMLTAGVDLKRRGG